MDDLEKQLADAEAKGVAEGLRQAQVNVDTSSQAYARLADEHERLKRVLRALVEALPLRNDSEMDVHCHAFTLPGSRGTPDCIRQLEAQGFTVTVHPP